MNVCVLLIALGCCVSDHAGSDCESNHLIGMNKYFILYFSNNPIARTSAMKEQLEYETSSSV